MAALPMILNCVEVVVLLAAFASGIAVATLVGQARDDFQADCPFYADIVWTSPTYFNVEPDNSVAKCSYVIGVQAIAVIVAFCYAAYRLVVMVTNRFEISLMRIIAAPVYAIFTFLILVQASLVTMGILSLCWGLQSEPTYANTHCGKFQEVAWQHYDGSRFYDILKMSEGASWVSFLSWCVLIIMTIVNVVYENKYAKMGDSSS